MMNESQLYNLANNNFWWIFILIIYFLCGISWFLTLVLIEDRKKSKEDRIEFRVVLTTAISLTVLAYVLTSNTAHHFNSPSYNDSKYYIVKNIPLAKYSLKSNQFETKSGKVIKDVSITTNNSIKVDHEKVQLKEYKLKKKWYGMNGVPRTVYQAYVLEPTRNVKTVKD